MTAHGTELCHHKQDGLDCAQILHHPVRTVRTKFRKLCALANRLRHCLPADDVKAMSRKKLFRIDRQQP